MIHSPKPQVGVIGHAAFTAIPSPPQMGAEKLPPTFHGPQFGVSREKLEALAKKWETDAEDTRWNGHLRATWEQCARELRELIK